MGATEVKDPLRSILRKVLGVFLALVFLVLALLGFLYPAASFLTAHFGKEAKVAGVSDHLGKCRTGFRVGGLFTLSLAVDKGPDPAHHKKEKIETFGKVYALYPVWPDQLQPLAGDLVQAWPAKKPLLAMPATDGWGWFLVGTVLVVGLILLEFAFLALTLR